MREIKVVHVHLIFERRDYYFGSISAIFDTLDESGVGIKELYVVISSRKIYYSDIVDFSEIRLIQVITFSTESSKSMIFTPLISNRETIQVKKKMRLKIDYTRELITRWSKGKHPASL